MMRNSARQIDMEYIPHDAEHIPHDAEHIPHDAELRILRNSILDFNFIPSPIGLTIAVSLTPRKV